MDYQKKGKLIIFSAPSGAGKTTLAKHVLANFKNVMFSVSACSRKPRAGEQHGVEYYFMSVSDFKQKILEGAFVEWEEVYPNHFYGTLISEVERIRDNGNHVLFDVDVVGGLNIKKKFGDDALAIFVKPPSVESLITRLKNRSTDSDKEIKLRIKKATYELTFESHFDKVIVNDDLETAMQETTEIVHNFITN
jgi:guanylate kinase